MTRTEYRRLIEYRVNYINERLGTKYTTDYVAHYGGWAMYEVDQETGGHYRNVLGFDVRKSNAEMLNYVDGIFQLLCFYKLKKE